jgi:hypothetical protein
VKWVWIAAGTLVLIVAVIALIGAMLPKGHHATRQARFAQRPEALYAVISGPPNWRSDIEEHGTLPDGKWWERDSHGNKITYELVEDRPPSRRVVRMADPTLPFGGAWTLEVTPAEVTPGAAGSTVRVTEDGEVYNVLFRFMARFIFGHTATIDTYLRDLGRKFGETIRIED